LFRAEQLQTCYLPVLGITNAANENLIPTLPH
jgi:hypothetical protein